MNVRRCLKAYQPRFLNAVQVAAEMRPYVSSGRGLSQILGQVPRLLGRWGINNHVFIPGHRLARENIPRVNPGETRLVKVNLADQETTVEINQHQLPKKGNLFLYTVNHPFFDTEDLYFHPRPIDLQRSALFCQAVLKGILSYDLKPDLINAHDWFTALVHVYLNLVYRDNKSLASARKLFTVHDISYQGDFEPKEFGVTRLPWEVFASSMEYFGKVSLLKGGMNFADLVLVRDRRYLAELRAEQYGGFSGVVQELESRGRIAPLADDLGSWPPQSEELTEEVAGEWAAGEVGLYRSLFRFHFWGMMHGRVFEQPFTPLVKTREERLQEVNPWLAETYLIPDSFTRRNKDRIRRTLEEGHEYLFANIRGPQDLVRLTDQLGRVDWREVARLGEELNGFTPIDARRRLELVRSFPALPLAVNSEYDKLRELGKESLPGIVKVTLAGRHDIDIFHEHSYLNRGLLPLGDHGSFFSLHARDILEAQQITGEQIPWHILISPAARRATVAHFSHFEYFGLEPAQVNFIDRRQLSPGLIRDSERIDPATDQPRIRLAMDREGKQILFFPSGSGYLLSHLSQGGLLTELQKQGKSHLFISAVGNLGGLISRPDFLPILGSLRDSRSPLLCELADPRGQQGAVVVQEERGSAFAAEDFVLSEALRYEAQRSTLPVLTSSYLMDIRSMDRVFKSGSIIPKLRPEPRSMGYGEFFVMRTNISDITQHVPDAVYLKVGPERFIYPRFRGEYAEAIGRYEEYLKK